MPSRLRYGLLGAHFTRSCDVIDCVANSCRWSIGTDPLSLAVLRYLHLNISGPRCWHFRVTWCYWSWEIINPKNFGVTTLTFLGHVTSSVTWPIDSPYVICYWLSIDTEALSLNVFEIFDPKHPCAHTDTQTDTRRKWFYILSHAMYCIGQTITSAIANSDSLWLRWGASVSEMLMLKQTNSLLLWINNDVLRRSQVAVNDHFPYASLDRRSQRLDTDHFVQSVCPVNVHRRPVNCYSIHLHASVAIRWKRNWLN